MNGASGKKWLVIRNDVKSTRMGADGITQWASLPEGARLPEELHWVERPDGTRRKVRPGQLREEEVRVGRHVAPPARSLPAFLARYEEAYAPERLAWPTCRSSDCS